MTEKNYMKIVSHYEECLDKHGDSHLGVDWPNSKDAESRYRVMLELIRKPVPSEVTLLDFGCGLSHLYTYIQKHNINYIKYAGLDISEKFITVSKNKYPSTPYYCMDILREEVELPVFDYIILNGVFTEKRELSYDDMLNYFKQITLKVFKSANIGVSFNVMSSHVDWERGDLFHLPLDTLANFLVKEVTRDFIIRNDYQLYEYTTYLYRR